VAAPIISEVTEASIAQLQADQAAGRLSSVQLVDAYLRRIAAYDQSGPALNAIVRLNPAARDEARALDLERRKGGPRGPLHGIPILVKDNFATLGMPTAAGALALATLQTGDDAFTVKRLQAAGAIILGKTTLQELAAGITTVSSLTGVTRNPYDPALSPGGSSGGTAAAIAASFAAAGMGSDTCGSIRIPAAYQNLYGLRSTMGLLSRSGIVPLSSSQDVPGPLARSVGDLAILLDAIAAPDPADAVTMVAGRGAAPPYIDSVRADGLQGSRIGIIRELFSDAPEGEEGKALLEAAFARMRDAGAEVIDIPLKPLMEMMRDTSVIDYELKSDLAAFLAQQANPPVSSLKEIIDLGLDHEQVDRRLRQRAAAPSRDAPGYAKALRKREDLRKLIVRTLADHRLDALAYPISQISPPLAGQARVLGGHCQLSASTGLPAMAIPVGFLGDGLPVGMELMGAPFTERTLIKLAAGWEDKAHTRQAPFTTPPLINGRAPPPAKLTATAKHHNVVTSAKLRYDVTTGRLTYDVAVRGVPAPSMIGVMLHRTGGGTNGPVVARLVGQGLTSAKGELIFSARDRQDLAAGQLYVSTYTITAPLGLSRIVLPRLAAW
jgi:Asp-tRNA(Asn)/Glu-tRNA(Gln) amidotransferase A subunit family amidase